MNWLLLSAVNKNNLKQILKSLEKEINTQKYLFWFTIIPKATFSSHKRIGIPLCNQSHITNHTHQRSDIEPLKNTHFF